MGLEDGKDKPAKKAKPKLALVDRKAESQDKHGNKIDQAKVKLDRKASSREDAARKVGATDPEVATLRKKHTASKLRLKTAAAVRLETRGEYAFMLKAGVRVTLGKIFGKPLEVKFRQEIKLSGKPGERKAELYKLKLETKVLGAVLGLEGYQQRPKTKMYFGYTVSNGTLKITFLGQYEKNSRLKNSEC